MKLVPLIAAVLLTASCNRQMLDVARLSDDALQGRNNLTPGSIAAQDYLIHRLSSFAVGLNSAAELVASDGTRVQGATFKQPFADGTNILAVIRGKERPDEYVMLGAHYDHLGKSCESAHPDTDTICNGATDNATGVSVVLAAGQALARKPPSRSVILALWDAEEDGLLGSQHYIAHPLVPLSRTVAYVNVDVQGANLLPSLRTTTFAVGAETGGETLRSVVHDAAATGPLNTHLLTSPFARDGSDQVSFSDAGIPAVFLSDSLGPCYHTADDEFGVVDFRKLHAETQTAQRLTRALAQETRPLVFSQGGDLPNFDDVLVVDEVLNSATADLGRFSDTEQEQLLQFRADLARIVGDGPSNFDIDDILTVAFGTLNAFDIVRAQPCDGYLTHRSAVD